LSFIGQRFESVCFRFDSNLNCGDIIQRDHENRRHSKDAQSRSVSSVPDSLTSGQKFPVEHPDNMSLPDDEREMFVIWTSKDWNLVDAEQVARLSTHRRNSK